MHVANKSALAASDHAVLEFSGDLDISTSFDHFCLRKNKNKTACLNPGGIPRHFMLRPEGGQTSPFNRIQQKILGKTFCGMGTLTSG
jgi:hypothetical protein